MQRLRRRFPRLWLGAELLSFLATPAFLALDLSGLFTDVKWQWWAIGSLLIFGLLVYFHISDLLTELRRVKSDQKTELAIRRLQESGERLSVRLRIKEASRDDAKQWTLETEESLEELGFELDVLRHFRGETPDDPLGEWLGIEGEFLAVHADYVDSRRQRLGEILFSLPGPSSNVLRLG